jgi:hypothetical protein
MAAACSSGEQQDPFGASPDFDGLQQKLTRPTGTLVQGRESAIVEAFVAERSAQKEVDISGPTLRGGSSSSGGASTQSLRTMGDTTWAQSCFSNVYGNRSGGCSCPSGGSLAWEVWGNGAQNGGDGASTAWGGYRFRYDQCAWDDVRVNGYAHFAVKATRDAASAGPSSFSMILSAHGDYTRAGETRKFDYEYLFEGGQYWISIKVDDGYVVVASQDYDPSSRSGTVYIRHKNGTTTCVFTNGEAKCN